MEYKAAGLMFFPIFILSFLIAALLLPMAWRLANGTRNVGFLVLVATLLTWLVLGGGYMEWAMYHSWPIDIDFIIIAATPIFAPAVYIYILVKHSRNTKQS